MNQHVMQRETATNPAFRSRETREVNPYDRIVFAGAANRFQVLRKAFTRGRGELKACGSFETLQEAIEARDRLPLEIHPALRPKDDNTE